MSRRMISAVLGIASTALLAVLALLYLNHSQDSPKIKQAESPGYPQHEIFQPKEPLSPSRTQPQARTAKFNDWLARANLERKGFKSSVRRELASIIKESPQVVNEAIDGLRTPGEVGYHSAMLIIAVISQELSFTEAVKALTEVFSDVSISIEARLAAIGSLPVSAPLPKETVQALLGLSEWSNQIGMVALDRLATAAGEPEALDANAKAQLSKTIDALYSKSLEMQDAEGLKMSHRVMGKLKSASADATIRRDLSSGQAAIRESAVSSLAHLNPVDRVSIAVNMFNRDTNDRVRLAAIDSVLPATQEKEVPKLLPGELSMVLDSFNAAVAHESSVRVRDRVVMWLGTYYGRDREAPPHVIDMLRRISNQDPDAGVRKNATWVLKYRFGIS